MCQEEHFWWSIHDGFHHHLRKKWNTLLVVMLVLVTLQGYDWVAYLEQLALKTSGDGFVSSMCLGPQLEAMY